LQRHPRCLRHDRRSTGLLQQRCAFGRAARTFSSAFSPDLLCLTMTCLSLMCGHLGLVFAMLGFTKDRLLVPLITYNRPNQYTPFLLLFFSFDFSISGL
jgi:hypothetical protein